MHMFLLAEADKPGLHEKAFNASYDWKLHHIMNSIAKGDSTANAIARHFKMVDTDYPENSVLLQFTSNHDENSWNGTVFERLGYGVEAFAVLSFTIPGMPLIYNGQEAAMSKRLEFFEKDPIEWKDYEKSDFYKTLINLRKTNRALWSGIDGGNFTRINTSNNKEVFVFLREKDNNKIFVALNLSPNDLVITLIGDIPEGVYKNIFTSEETSYNKGQEIQLDAWDYIVCEVL